MSRKNNGSRRARSGEQRSEPREYTPTERQVTAPLAPGGESVMLGRWEGERMTEEEWLGCDDPRPMLQFVAGRLKRPETSAVPLRVLRPGARRHPVPATTLPRLLPR